MYFANAASKIYIMRHGVVYIMRLVEVYVLSSLAMIFLNIQIHVRIFFKCIRPHYLFIDFHLIFYIQYVIVREK